MFKRSLSSARTHPAPPLKCQWCKERLCVCDPELPRGRSRGCEGPRWREEGSVWVSNEDKQPSSQGQPREDEAPRSLDTRECDGEPPRRYDSLCWGRSLMGVSGGLWPPSGGLCHQVLRLRLALAEMSPSRHVRSHFAHLSMVTLKQKYSGGRKKIILEKASRMTRLTGCHLRKTGTSQGNAKCANAMTRSGGTWCRGLEWSREDAP